MKFYFTWRNVKIMIPSWVPEMNTNTEGRIIIRGTASLLNVFA